MAEIGEIVRSEKEQEVRYTDAVQYSIILPKRSISLKMTCFCGGLSQAIAVFLAVVNKDRQENGLSPVGTSKALMFLMAKKFNAERAINLYKRYQVREILGFYCILSSFWDVWEIIKKKVPKRG